MKYLIHFLIFSFAITTINAQSKNASFIKNDCLTLLKNEEAYQNLINENDVVFIFVELSSKNTNSLLDFSKDEIQILIEQQNISINEISVNQNNVILFRRSAYLNLEAQKQLEFKNWFKKFDFWIEKQLEKNINLPKIIFLPPTDLIILKAYLCNL
jgi:hypothetical protein